MLHQLIPQPTARDIAATLIAESLSYPPGSPDWEYRRRAWRERMTQIDTSKEAVERLRRNDARLHAMIEKLVDAGAKCVAERDAQTARADAAEAEVARLTAELTSLRAGQDALVAAAYEAAADNAGGAWFFSFPTDDRKEPYRNAARAIRALTPADATAALDSMLRAERDKALRDAAGALCEWGDDSSQSGQFFSELILAMIEPEDQTNDR